MLKRNLISLIVGLLLCANCMFSQKRGGIEISGDVIQGLLPLAAGASTLIYKDNENAKWQFVKTMGTSLATTLILKKVINKERPNGEDYAFPSGHTSNAFAGAAFLERRFGWEVGIPAYLLASYVGWTRVDADKHDYWDVLGGAVVGVGSAYLFTKSYQKQQVQVAFGKSKEYYLFNLNYTF